MSHLEYEYQAMSLLFIAPLALVFYYYLFRVYNRPPQLRFSAIANFSKQKHHSIFWYKVKSQVVLWLNVAGICCLVVAAMNPVRVHDIESVNQFGIDMVVTLDISGSMKKEDFRPKNRFVAARNILYDFVQGRKNDRLGLVIFAHDAYVQSPQTTDINALLQIIEQLHMGWIPSRYTSIGSALAVSASRLAESPSENRLIIIITDGEDNALDKIRPMVAAEAVKELGIKVYSVGIGTQQVDFSELKQISEMTGGRFFRATNSQQFVAQMQELDRLEKSLVRKDRYRVVTEYSSYFIWAALALLLSGLFIRSYVLPERLQ